MCGQKGHEMCDVLLHTRCTLRCESLLFFSHRADDHLCESVNAKMYDVDGFKMGYTYSMEMQ